ncbi:hypothetical protein FACS189413_12170 [Bacteroidia bacterium]|nr:hypothetical protein FACS189413_12170 [Bacteroidia bacterium]
MNNPEISIVIPVYNAEKYLLECLESIINQTIPNWEVLLIDDGSTDGSPEICEDYARKDARIRVFHQPNSGASAARNKGIDEAQGHWITFVDSDDWIAAGYLEKLLNTLTGQQVEAVFCNCFLVQKNEITPNYVYPGNTLLEGSEVLRKSLLIFGMRSELWGKMFKREFLNAHRINQNLRIGEDMLYLFELYNLHPQKTAILKEPLYYYRQLETSVMRTGNLVQNIKDTLLAYEQFVRDYPDIKEKYPVENATYIVRLLTLFTKQDVITQFKDPYALQLLKDNFETAKNNLNANEIRFIRMLYVHPWLAKTGVEINNLKYRFKKK